jgi:hypothetical protein
MHSSRVLTIRVSGKERKEKVRKLLLDLAHFKNLWCSFQKLLQLYNNYCNYTINNATILCGRLL